MSAPPKAPSLSNAPTQAPPGTGHEPEEPPPFLGTWRNVYTLLVVELLGIAALLYALTRWLS